MCVSVCESVCEGVCEGVSATTTFLKYQNTTNAGCEILLITEAVNDSLRL